MTGAVRVDVGVGRRTRPLGPQTVDFAPPRPRTDAPAGRLRPGTRHPQIALTHVQLAALAGTSRETTTKVLREFAERGLLRLARGRITVLDPARLLDEAG